MKKNTIISIIAFLTLISTNSPLNSDPATIAVLEFEITSGLPESNSGILTDIFSDELFHTGMFKILERNNMNDILSEQGFQMAGCVSNECAVEVGQLLGVQQMIVGSVGKLGQKYIITARLIDVTTGKQLRSERVSFIGALEDIEGSMGKLAKRLAGLKHQTAITSKKKVEQKPIVNKPTPSKPAFTAPDLTNTKWEIYTTPKSVIGKNPLKYKLKPNGKLGYFGVINPLRKSMRSSSGWTQNNDIVAIYHKVDNVPHYLRLEGKFVNSNRIEGTGKSYKDGTYGRPGKSTEVKWYAVRAN